MNKEKSGKKSRELRGVSSGAKQVMSEPILKTLLGRSFLTTAQLETLLIDLVVEDQIGDHVPYEDKATIRTKSGSRAAGVSRGAFNRTLNQARRNVTRCLHTMLLLAYLGLFDFSVFRPFEEIATKIGDYRRIREVLSGREGLSNEDVESYRTAERTINEALDELASPLILKSELSRKKTTSANN
ncbi:MAG: hypothetical protein ACW98Y_00710 [Candidatus Thorarchaeota archaeon]|jgi:hypothetical protein